MNQSVVDNWVWSGLEPWHRVRRVQGKTWVQIVAGGRNLSGTQHGERINSSAAKFSKAWKDWNAMDISCHLTLKHQENLVLFAHVFWFRFAIIFNAQSFEFTSFIFSSCFSFSSLLSGFQCCLFCLTMTLPLVVFEILHWMSLSDLKATLQHLDKVGYKYMPSTVEWGGGFHTTSINISCTLLQITPFLKAWMHEAWFKNWQLYSHIE